MQNEVVLPKEALAASPFDLVCLGHIHRAQSVPGCGKPVYYSGSINRLNFNEEMQAKGFWIHEIGENNFTTLHEYKESRFIETPARPFVTIEVAKDNNRDWPAMFADNPREAMIVYAREVVPCKDAVTRFLYTCDEETKKKLSHKSIEKAIYDNGAFYVSEVRPAQVFMALVKQEMSENKGPMKNLRSWCQAQELALEEIQALEVLAEPLISTVSARIPTGKLSGTFVPRSIEVGNYRSYREVTFDFDKVTFATVNGPNGVGKSALFMDALMVCLYEETREDELGGWITRDTNIRSGSITFKFDMGTTTWQVIRTRAKSGKTTLSLQELVEGQWADRSADKVKDTQEKIIALLGMDAMTLQCCGMIMQDAYGVFLQADRSDRMEVLANILGLGVYEQLEKLAKEKVTETKRALAAAKDKIAELDEKLKAKPAHETDLAAVNTELSQLAAELETKETALKETEDLARDLEAKVVKVEELNVQITQSNNEIQTLHNEQTTQQQRLAKANEVLARKDEIISKAAEYERVKEQVAVLQSKKPRLIELTTEEKRISREKEQVTKYIQNITPQIQDIENMMQNRESLMADAARYQETVAALEQQDKLADKWTRLDNDVRNIMDQLIREEAQIDKHVAQLTSLLKMKEQQAGRLTDPNLNCINVSVAKCALLADAIDAWAEMEKARNDLEKIDRTEIISLQQRYDTLISERNALGYNQPGHKEIRETVAQLRHSAEQAAQLSNKTELLENLQSQKRQHNSRSNELTTQLSNTRAAAQNLALELKSLPDLESSLPALAKWVNAKEQIPAAQQIIDSTNERIEALAKEITVKEGQVKELEQQRHLLQVETASLPVTKANIENYLGHIKALQEQQNNLHVKAGGLKAQLEALGMDEERRQQKTAEMGPLAVVLTRYQTLAKLFGQDGIPFSIVRSVVPELSAMANDILGQMTGGKMAMQMKTERVQKTNKREVNTLEIWITESQHGSLPYKSLSGGQKVKAALSVAFALADLKARRAGIQLGMLFIDEPPFLDEEGIDAYCDALELVSQRYPGMKVMSISHDRRMKARFPQEIDIQYQEGVGSQVKLVAS